MPRRSHKKSRTGCLECKRRHIKCDEHKPKCVNCATASTPCSFEVLAPVISHPSSGSSSSINETLQQPPLPILSNHSTANSVDVGLAHPSTINSGLNLQHLELLHHWMVSTSTTLAQETSRQELYRGVVIREALEYPFLMNQILGIAALHLSALHDDSSPSRRQHYLALATDIQTAAMAGFKAHQASKGTTAESCLALLVFSSLVGLHVFADRSRTEALNGSGSSGSSSSELLDHLIHCIRLMQGVRILVVDEWWAHIKSSPDIAVFVGVDDDPPTRYPVPEQVRALRALVSDGGARLGDAAVRTYHESLDMLEWQYAASGAPAETSTTVRYVMAWPIKTTSEFLALLEQRRAEALIVLAYYAVGVHSCRRCWAVGDTGERLVLAIDAMLGADWEGWMEWPLQVLREAKRVDQIDSVS